MQRIRYIDFLRQIAIYYMFFFHTVLVLLPRGEIRGAIGFLFELVPLDAALFLFLAGFSLALSLKKHGEISPWKFQNKQLRRGLFLICGSAVLFFLQLGFQLPDIFFSSGILNTIGWLCLIGGIVGVIPQQKTFVALLITVLLILTIIFETRQIFVFPLNWGYEPLSPTIIFGLIGLWFGLFQNRLENREQARRAFLILGLAGAALLACFALGNNVFILLKSDRVIIKREFAAAATLEGLCGGGGALTQMFIAVVWNYKIMSFLISLAVVCLLFSLGFFLESLLLRFVPPAIFLPGAHALSNYFFHLFALALIVILAGQAVFPLWAVLSVLGLLYLGSYLLPLVIISLKKRIQGRPVS